MENQFNYNMSAMSLCWPTYILRHFFGYFTTTMWLLGVERCRICKMQKKLRLATKGSQNKTTTRHLARARPRLCLHSHSLAGRRLPRPHPHPPESTSWLVFVNFCGFSPSLPLDISCDSHRQPIELICKLAQRV